MKQQGAIGIFDSGVGGLSVCHAVRRQLPSENLIYFADQLYSPYGEKPSTLINKRSEQISEFLVEQGCKALVVACNTATTNAISELRAKFHTPIIGVEPGIKVAALTSKTGHVGVLATTQTLASHSYRQLAQTYSGKVQINAIACPEFIPLVENLEHESKQAFDVVAHYISPLLSKGCDKIVLGCTHFSFLWRALIEAVGDNAELIDTADPVAAQVKKTLHKHDLATSAASPGKIDFWTSSDTYPATQSIQALWGTELTLHRNTLSQ